MLDEASKFQQDLETHRDLCERVSGYYMAERYPPLSDFELTVADIRRDLKEAREFVKLMFPREKLPLLKKVGPRVEPVSPLGAEYITCHDTTVSQAPYRS